MKAFVIIPAKGDSKRLVGKNKRVIAGKTLLEHSIEYAQQSKLATSIIVSTEDVETKRIAESYGVNVVGRTEDYMGEREVADVYINLFREFGDTTFTHVVGIQPDHPDRTIPLDDMLTFDFDFLYLLQKTAHPIAGMVDKRVSTCYVLQQLLGTDRVKYDPVAHLGFIKPSTKNDLLTIDTVTPSLTFSDSFRAICPTKLIYSRK